MSDSRLAEAYEAHARRREGEESQQPKHEETATSNPAQEVVSPRLLLDAGLGHKANAPARAAAMQGMQRTHGNRAVQRFTQREAATQPAVTPVPVQRFLDGLLGGMPDFKGMGIGQPFMPDGGMTGSLPDFGLPDLGQFGIGSPFEMDPQYLMD
jgi:hypothetical protein